MADVLDEPFGDASVLPTYLLSRFTRESVTVALAGTEATSSSPATRPSPPSRSRGSTRCRGSCTSAPSSRSPTSFPSRPRTSASTSRSSASCAAPRSPPTGRHPAWLGSFTPAEQEALLERAPADPVRGAASAPTRMRRPATRSSGSSTSYAKTYLQDDILVKVDRASMACSLEVRAPFLDVELVELLGRVPPRLKLRGLTTKHLLKRAMADLLPQGIAGRAKKGFGIPVAEWLKTDLREPVQDELSPERLSARGSSRRTKSAACSPSTSPGAATTASSSGPCSASSSGTAASPSGARRRLPSSRAPRWPRGPSPTRACASRRCSRSSGSSPRSSARSGRPSASARRTPGRRRRCRQVSRRASGTRRCSSRGTGRSRSPPRCRARCRRRLPRPGRRRRCSQPHASRSGQAGSRSRRAARRTRSVAWATTSSPRSGAGCPHTLRLAGRSAGRSRTESGQTVEPGASSRCPSSRASSRRSTSAPGRARRSSSTPESTPSRTPRVRRSPGSSPSLAIARRARPGRVRPPASAPDRRPVAPAGERAPRRRRRRRRARRLVGALPRVLGRRLGRGARAHVRAPRRLLELLRRARRNLPVAYWLEWSQHWLTQSVEALLVLRLPSLVLLAATWVLCRWVLAAHRGAEPASRSGRSTAAFLAGAMAGGMTLRPEPVTAFFLVAVLACVVRFRERESAGPLALATVLVPLAILGHPAGILTLAPLLVVGADIFRWARANVAAAGTLLASGIGLFAVLAFVGSDLEQRRSDAQWTRTYGPHADWRDEFLRYSCSRTTRTARRCGGRRWRSSGSPCSRSSCDGGGTGSPSRPPRGVARPDADPPARDPEPASLPVRRAPRARGGRSRRGDGAAARRGRRLERLEGEAVPRARSGDAGRRLGVVAAARLESARPADVDWTPGIEDSLPLQSLAVALPFLLLAGALLVARRRRGRPRGGALARRGLDRARPRAPARRLHRQPSSQRTRRRRTAGRSRARTSTRSAATSAAAWRTASRSSTGSHCAVPSPDCPRRRPCRRVGARRARRRPRALHPRPRRPRARAPRRGSRSLRWALRRSSSPGRRPRAIASSSSSSAAAESASGPRRSPRSS